MDDITWAARVNVDLTPSHMQSVQRPHHSRSGVAIGSEREDHNAVQSCDAPDRHSRDRRRLLHLPRSNIRSGTLGTMLLLLTATLLLAVGCSSPLYVAQAGPRFPWLLPVLAITLAYGGLSLLFCQSPSALSTGAADRRIASLQHGKTQSPTLSKPSVRRFGDGLHALAIQ